jgi:hypothetical protein
VASLDDADAAIRVEQNGVECVHDRSPATWSVQIACATEGAGMFTVFIASTQWLSSSTVSPKQSLPGIGCSTEQCVVVSNSSGRSMWQFHCTGGPSSLQNA